MTERTPEDESVGGTHPLDERGLDDLRRRLDELQGSIERLGTEDAPPPPPPPAPHAPTYGQPQDFGHPPVPPEPPPAPPTPPYDAPPPAEPYGAPPPVPPMGAPAPEPAYEQPEVPTPAPAATNGHTEETPAAVSASIATLDAGPFSDLVELRRFEETLAELGPVRDVRVRRFGHRRARIEVGMAGAHALIRELQRIGRPMRIEQGPEGEVVVELPDPEAATADAPDGSPAAEAQSTGAEADDSGGDG